MLPWGHIFDYSVYPFSFKPEGHELAEQFFQVF